MYQLMRITFTTLLVAAICGEVKAEAFTVAKWVSVDFPSSDAAVISLTAEDGSGSRLVFSGNEFSASVSEWPGFPIHSSTTDFLAQATTDFLLLDGRVDGESMSLSIARGVSAEGVSTQFRLVTSELTIPDVLPVEPYVIQASAKLELEFLWAKQEECVRFNPPEGRPCVISPNGLQPDLLLDIETEGVLEMTLVRGVDQTLEFTHDISSITFNAVPEPSSLGMARIGLVLALIFLWRQRRD